MVEFSEIFSGLGGIDRLLQIFTLIVVVGVAYVLFKVLLGFAKKRLLKVAKTKKQISTIEIFSRIFKYLFWVFFALVLVFYFSGSFTGLGLAVGLFSAGLGLALQRPISGIAAWLMVVSNRPFEIGDRVIIGSIKGDIMDITLSHIYLKELGGLIPGSEENSGRIVLIPNAMLFEQNITNYTFKNEFILDEIVVSVTYESDLDEAVGICLSGAKKVTREIIVQTKKDPYIRNYFKPSGIDLHLRFFAPARKVQQFSSDVTKEVFESIKKSHNVHFAYPHTEIVLKSNPDEEKTKLRKIIQWINDE